MPRARPYLLLLAVVALAAIGALVRSDGEAGAPVPTVPAPRAAPETAAADPIPDPFAWAPERAEEFAERAARGHAHVLHARSPGGAQATATRTARWRELVERAAEEAGVEADRLEALVFLESAGRPDAMAAGGTESAVGLTQILAETGQNLLGMRVEVAESARLTRRIARERARGPRRARTLARLEARRRVVDERYDPAKALAAAGRYLAMARERFDREDLAFVSYHMGMGNLEDVLAAYGTRDVAWVEVFFASTPRRQADAHALLRSFGDESSAYFWKLEAAREIMRLAREDPDELGRLALLHAAKGSAEEVLHPLGSTPRFMRPADLRAAWDAGDVRAFPDAPARTALRRDPRMGELARRLDVPAGLYRGLRPEALALALYIGAQVRDVAGAGTLTVTSTVRDQRYQDLLAGTNREATRGYSLHTTGWAFDVARDYRSRRQALAFQWMLDRLQALDVLAWVREPGAIHITAGPGAEVLLPLLDRLDG